MISRIGKPWENRDNECPGVEWYRRMSAERGI